MTDRVWRVGTWSFGEDESDVKYSFHKHEQSASVELWRQGKILVGSALEDDPAVAAEFNSFSQRLIVGKLPSAVKFFNSSELLSDGGSACTLSIDSAPLNG